MFGTTRGTLVPARKWLLAFSFALIAAAPVAARADDGMVDVRTLPRLEGAVEDAARTRSDSLSYGVPTVVESEDICETEAQRPRAFRISTYSWCVPDILRKTKTTTSFVVSCHAPVRSVSAWICSTTRSNATAATRKLLAANGWVQYVQPLEESSNLLLFKKGRQGLYVSFTQGLGRPDQSAAYYTANRINANLPFPDDATSIVFDENRPYLGCITAATVDATLDFFRRELVASGWSPLSAAGAAVRWPNADIEARIGNGVRAYYNRDSRDGGYKQPPIMLSLQRRDDGRTSVDIKVAPFALPTTPGV
jgi:hypothetical protein